MPTRCHQKKSPDHLFGGAFFVPCRREVRDSLRTELQANVPEAYESVGIVDGRRYAYDVFLAWDLPAVLEAAREFAEGRDDVLELGREAGGLQSGSPKKPDRQRKPCTRLTRFSKCLGRGFRTRTSGGCRKQHRDDSRTDPEPSVDHHLEARDESNL